MQRAGRRIRLGYLLKFIENGKVVLTVRRRIKAGILAAIKANSASEYYLKVYYKKDFYNDGVFPTKEKLLHALSCFTEKPLLDYLE